MEDARPGSAGEEEMQLQIALAMSKEESEKEEELRKQDDIGLQVISKFSSAKFVICFLSYLILTFLN